MPTFSILGGRNRNLPKCSQCYVRWDTDKQRCPCCNQRLSRKGAVAGATAKKRVDNKVRID